MTPQPATYPRHRFPAEINSYAVWLYHVFSLSLRDIELSLAERGVAVTHESVRRWCLKFGQTFASRLRRRRPRPGDIWYLDEVFIRINGALHYLWRAVDQHGVVLDILVQDRRNANAAKRFFKRLLRGLRYKPRRLVTDGLRSYGVAQREVLPDVQHRTSRYLNNRAENFHRPTRRRERQMQRFKSAQQAQRFLSVHGSLYGHFRPRRHLMTAGGYRRARAKAFRVWRQETCVQIRPDVGAATHRSVTRRPVPVNVAIPFPDLTFVQLGSLDDPAGIEPKLETFVKRRLAWSKPLDLPQWEAM